MVLEETQGDLEKTMDILLGMAGDDNQGQAFVLSCADSIKMSEVGILVVLGGYETNFHTSISSKIKNYRYGIKNYLENS